MPMETDKNKTKQRPQKERDPEDHTPPRLRREQRPFGFGQISPGRAIQDYRPFDSKCSGHFFLRLPRLHASTSTGFWTPGRFVSVPLWTLRVGEAGISLRTSRGRLGLG